MKKASERVGGGRPGTPIESFATPTAGDLGPMTVGRNLTVPQLTTPIDAQLSRGRLPVIRPVDPFSYTHHAQIDLFFVKICEMFKKCREGGFFCMGKWKKRSISPKFCMRAKYKVAFFVGLSQIRRSWDLVKIVRNGQEGPDRVCRVPVSDGSQVKVIPMKWVPVQGGALNDHPYRRLHRREGDTRDT